MMKDVSVLKSTAAILLLLLPIVWRKQLRFISMALIEALAETRQWTVCQRCQHLCVFVWVQDWGLWKDLFGCGRKCVSVLFPCWSMQVCESTFVCVNFELGSVREKAEWANRCISNMKRLK